MRVLHGFTGGAAGGSSDSDGRGDDEAADAHTLTFSGNDDGRKQMANSGTAIAGTAITAGTLTPEAAHLGFARHGNGIGRVGALAVALGVGMAIGIAAPLAAADSEGATESTSSPGAGTRSHTASDTAVQSHAGGRQQRPSIALSPSGGTTDGPRHRSRAPGAAAARPSTVVGNTGSDGLPTASAPGATAGTTPSLGKTAAVNDLPDTAAAVTRVDDDNRVAAVPSAPAPAASSAAVRNVPFPRWNAAASATDAVLPPAMTAVPAHTADTVSVFAPLLAGGDPQAPVDSPVSWVVLAAARGQVGRGRSGAAGASRTAVLSAAAVPTLVAGTPTVGSPDVRTGTVYGGAKFTNVAAGALTFSAPATSAGGGAVSVNTATGAFTYTPTGTQRRNAGLSTTDTFVVTASSGKLTATQTITVPVDPGTAVAGTPWVGTPAVASGAVAGAAKFTDGSGRTLTYSTPATTSGGGTVSINAATGSFTYTPTLSQRRNAGLATTDTFVVTADNGVRTTTQTISVAVDPGTPVSDTPWVRSPDAVTGAVNGFVKFADSAGRTLTYSAPSTTSAGASLSINAATGEFTYTPTPSQPRAGITPPDSFTVTASNGVRTTTQTITFPLTAVAPVAITPWVRTPLATSGVVTGIAKFSEGSGRALTFSAPSTSTGGGTVSINAATGDFTYTPSGAQRRGAGSNSTDSFTVTASNGSLTSTQVVVVGVDPGTPVAGTSWVRTPDSYTGGVIGTAKFTDGSGRTLTYSAPSTSVGGAAVSINAATGNFTYTPTQTQRRNAGASTTDSFTVTASNGVRTTTQTITVAVDPGTPVSGTPWVRTANRVTGAVTGIAKFTDPVSRALVYNAPATSAGGGAISINSGTGAFTYTPTQSQRQAAGQGTTDTFVVTVSNGVRTNTQTVTVSVNANAAPAVGNLGVTSSAGGVVNGTVTATDADADAVTFTASTPTNGTLSAFNPSTGAFTFTPTSQARHRAAADGAAQADSTATFTITANDGRGGVTPYEVSLNITPANAAPVFSAPSALTTSYTNRFYELRGAYNADPASPQIYGFDGPSNLLSRTQSSITTRTGIRQGVTGDIALDAAGHVYVVSGDPASTGTKSIYRWDSLSDWASNTNAALLGTRNSTAAVSGFAVYQDQFYFFEGDPNSPGEKTLRKWNTVTDWSAGQVGVAVGTRGTGAGIGFDIDSSGRVWFLDPTAPNSTTATATTGILFTWPSVSDFLVNANCASPFGYWTQLPFSFSGSLDQIGGLTVDRVPHVTGTVTAADADADTRTYSITSGPVNGGTVSIDSVTGEFTYTPSESGRRNAAVVTTDTFVVTATDGHGGSTSTTVTVPINA